VTEPPTSTASRPTTPAIQSPAPSPGSPTAASPVADLISRPATRTAAPQATAPAIQRVVRPGTAQAARPIAKPVVQRRSVGEPLTGLPDTATVAPPPAPPMATSDREPGHTPQPGSLRPPARSQNGSAVPEPPRDPIDALDMDELARRLFEPLNRMLRAEIRLDRERSGRSHERRY